VYDTSSSELPEDNTEMWQQIALACFMKESNSIPIIAIKRLCSAQFRDFAVQQLVKSPYPNG